MVAGWLAIGDVDDGDDAAVGAHNHLLSERNGINADNDVVSSLLN